MQGRVSCSVQVHCDKLSIKKTVIRGGQLMNENILLPSLTIHQQEEKNPLHMLASMENMRAS